MNQSSKIHRTIVWCIVLLTNQGEPNQHWYQSNSLWFKVANWVQNTAE